MTAERENLTHFYAKHANASNLWIDVNLVTEPKPHQRAANKANKTGGSSENASVSSESSVQTNGDSDNSCHTSTEAGCGTKASINHNEDYPTVSSDEQQRLSQEQVNRDDLSLSEHVICIASDEEASKATYASEDCKRIKLSNNCDRQPTTHHAQACTSSAPAAGTEMIYEGDNNSTSSRHDEYLSSFSMATVQDANLDFDTPTTVTTNSQESVKLPPPPTTPQSNHLWDNITSSPSASSEMSVDVNLSSTSKRQRLESLPLTIPQMQTDILICGNCRTLFTSLPLFIQHKRSSKCRLRFVCHCQHQ